MELVVIPQYIHQTVMLMKALIADEIVHGFCHLPIRPAAKFPLFQLPLFRSQLPDAVLPVFPGLPLFP